MTVHIIFRVVSMTGRHQELIDNIRIIVYLIVTESIFRIERRSHINTIQPYLIWINLLMPKATVGIPGMFIELTSHQCKRFLIFLIFRLFIDAEYKFTGVYTVKTILLTFVHFDSTICIYHCIGISQSIIIDFPIAVAVIHIQHGLQFQPVTIIPFQFRLKVQLPGFRTTNHFGLHHTYRPRQV